MKNKIIKTSIILSIMLSNTVLANNYVYRHYSPGVVAGSPAAPPTNNLSLGGDSPDNTICNNVGQFQEIRLKEGLENIGINRVLNDLSNTGVNISDPYFNLQENDFPISGAFISNQGYISFMKVHERSSGVLDLNNLDLYIVSDSAYESTVDESDYQMIVYELQECLEDDSSGINNDEGAV